MTIKIKWKYSIQTLAVLHGSSKVEAECQELKADNDLASQEVEALWAEKQAREAQIQQLEVVVIGTLIIVLVMSIITNTSPQ